MPPKVPDQSRWAPLLTREASFEEIQYFESCLFLVRTYIPYVKEPQCRTYLWEFGQFVDYLRGCSDAAEQVLSVQMLGFQ